MIEYSSMIGYPSAGGKPVVGKNEVMGPDVFSCDWDGLPTVWTFASDLQIVCIQWVLGIGLGIARGLGRGLGVGHW